MALLQVISGTGDPFAMQSMYAVLLKATDTSWGSVVQDGGTEKYRPLQSKKKRVKPHNLEINHTNFPVQIY